MVNTIEIRPCPQLRPYIRCYAYREIFITTGKLMRPVVAAHEFLITFNLTEIKYGFIRPDVSHNPAMEEMMDSSILITGLGTQFAGSITTTGYSRLFSIYFTPTGFFHIFGIPAHYFTDILEEDAYACNKDMKFLRESLMESSSRFQMVQYCEAFLLKQLSKRKPAHHSGCMQALSLQLLNSNSDQPVKKIAYDANMSIKTLERRFIEQVGASPKTFSRVLRFNKAVASKMITPQKTWTSIAHEYGYYDQMHFIRDFKKFSGTAPLDFFRNSPPPSENYID